MCKNALLDPAAKTNPSEFNEKDVKEILENALKKIESVLDAKPYELNVQEKKVLFRQNLLDELIHHYNNNELYRKFCTKIILILIIIRAIFIISLQYPFQFLKH